MLLIQTSLPSAHLLVFRMGLIILTSLLIRLLDSTNAYKVL